MQNCGKIGTFPYNEKRKETKKETKKEKSIEKNRSRRRKETQSFGASQVPTRSTPSNQATMVSHSLVTASGMTVNPN